MSLPVHTVRRATINHLEALRAIWSEERFAVGELERRFTEFQVVESREGKLIGALALQIQGNQGFIHSEAIALPEHTEALREVLWDRINKVAGNHGLVRLWTSAAHSHWTSAEFRAPTEAEQGKRPPQFGNVLEGWLVLQLKEESSQAISLEQELAIFREAQKAESLAFHQQANKIKLFVTIIAFLVLILVIVGGYLIVQYYQNPNKFKKSEPIPSGSEAPAIAPVSAPTNAPLPKPAAIPPPPAAPEVKAPR